MSDLFQDSSISEKNLLRTYLDLAVDPSAMVTKYRIVQLVKIVAGLLILFSGVAVYSYDPTRTIIFWLVLGGGVAIGTSFTSAQGAATAHIASKYLDADKIRQRLAELETEEDDSGS